MAIDKNRMKTSLFLALLMILTPFATASTVTTFSDGSSEVVIEFKDGYSLKTIQMVVLSSEVMKQSHLLQSILVQAQ